MYVHTALNAVCSLALSSFFLRELGTTEYGLYQTIAAFAAYLVLFELGTGTVITRNLSVSIAQGAEKEEINCNVSTVLAINHLLSCLIVVVGSVLYCFIDDIYTNTLTTFQIVYGKQIFVLVVINLLVVFYSQTINGVILAFGYYSTQAYVAIAQVLFRTVLCIIFILLSPKAIAIAFVDICVNIGICIYRWHVCKKYIGISLTKSIDKSIFFDSLPLCMALFLQTIVNQANNNVDKVVAGIVLGPDSVAVYSVVLFVYSMFSTITTVPISMNAPSVIKNVVEGDEGKKLVDKLISPSRLIVIVGGCVLFGFISTGEQFLELIYGSGYSIAWVAASMIMVPAFINMSNGILVNVLDARKKRMSRSVILGLTAIVNIILTIGWIGKYGIIGAAIATTVSMFIGPVMLMNVYYYLAMKLPIGYMFRKIYHGILPLQLGSMIITLIVKSMIENVTISFIICGCVFLCCFMLGFYFWGATPKEKNAVIRLLRKVG